MVRYATTYRPNYDLNVLNGKLFSSYMAALYTYHAYSIVNNIVIQIAENNI